MAKDQINGIIEDSKKALREEHDKFAESIKGELDYLKKKTLDPI